MSDEITVSELVTLLRAAGERMSPHNAHRPLMFMAASAIVQQTNRLWEATHPGEQPPVVAEPQVTLQ